MNAFLYGTRGIVLSLYVDRNMLFSACFVSAFIFRLSFNGFQHLAMIDDVFVLT